MESNQSLAKIGVFVLLGINVGAYYYFWPKHEDGSKIQAKAAAQEKREAKPVFGSVEEQEPKAFPVMPKLTAAPKTDAAVIEATTTPFEVNFVAIPKPPVVAQPVSTPRTVESKSADNDTDKILNLLDQIEKKAPPVEVVKREEPVFVPIVPDKPLPVAPIVPERKQPTEVAVASPLTPKTPPARWAYTADKAGPRTQLTARLREPGSERILVEFRVLCDRVDTTTQGIIKALGNVNFVGAGWKGSCQSMTLTLHESRLLFEDNVEVLQDILGTFQDSALRSDKITWDLPPTPAQPATQPTTGVTQPLFPVARPSLGGPG